MQVSKILLGARRLALTTKGGHNYYRGTRTGSMGNHTKYGGFRVDWDKVRTYPAAAETTVSIHLPYSSFMVETDNGTVDAVRVAQAGADERGEECWIDVPLGQGVPRELEARQLGRAAVTDIGDKGQVYIQSASAWTYYVKNGPRSGDSRRRSLTLGMCDFGVAQ